MSRLKQQAKSTARRSRPSRCWWPKAAGTSVARRPGVAAPRPGRRVRRWAGAVRRRVSGARRLCAGVNFQPIYSIHPVHLGILIRIY